MEFQQKYQMNFSLPEILGSETSRFQMFTPIEAIINEELYNFLTYFWTAPSNHLSFFRVFR